MDRSYIAFISYKHIKRDAAIAKEVHTLIENYIIPKSLRKGTKKLGVVFRDEEELPISSDLSESIRNALDSSRYLILICSPEAKESPWVSRELEYFLSTHDEKDVFAILTSGEPADVFPSGITQITNKQTEEHIKIEPLALDVRADALYTSLRKVRVHSKKLFAALIGCSYDSLIQREKARRRRRAILLLSALMLVLCCFSAIILAKNRELSDKNAQIIDANWETMVQETQLLSTEAAEAWEDVDIPKAIRYAADALYDENVARPYNALAERTLFSALNIFDNETNKLLLKKVEIVHSGPIDMMTYSDDGVFIYIIDSYGTVACYESSSGVSEWSVELQEPDWFSRVTFASQIYLDSKANVLICCYHGGISGLDASNGEVIWNHTTTERMAHGIIFDGQRQEAVYVEEVYSLSTNTTKSSYAYNFVSISTETGNVLHKVGMLEVEEPDRVYFPSNSNTSSGVFADSNRFVGSLFTLESGVCKAVLYVIDLSTDSVVYIDNETYEAEIDRYAYLQTFYTENNRALVVRQERGLIVRCFDISEMKFMWETRVEKADANISSADRCYSITWENDSLIAAGNFMCLIDGTNGTVLAQVGLFDRVIELYPIQAGVFGFHLANGYCAVGWANSYGLNDSSWWGATAYLPNTSMTITHNKGLFQAKVKSKQINGFTAASLQEGGGSVVYLSENRCTAYVTSVLPKPDTPEFEYVTWIGPAVDHLGSYLDTDPLSGTVLMGTASMSETYEKGLVVINVIEHSAKVIVTGEDVAYGDYFHLMPGGDEIVVATEFGDILLVDMSGAVHCLAERENVTLYSANYVSFLANRYAAASARQTVNHKVMTVRCNGNALEIWENGVLESTSNVPTNIHWAISDRTTRQMMLRIGENGLVVLSHYSPSSTKEMHSFAVYNVAKDEWKLIHDVAAGACDRIVGFGQVTPLFAVYDSDMHVRIYGWDQAEPMYCIKTELAASSILKVGLILDDQYLYVATKDGQFAVYELFTGASVYRMSNSDFIMGEDVAVWYDGSNSRLYICSGSCGECVDVRSWESIFSFEDTEFFAFYSAAQNEVYRITHDYTYYTSTEGLEFIRVPTTEELIKIAQKVSY